MRRFIKDNFIYILIFIILSFVFYIIYNTSISKYILNIDNVVRNYNSNNILILIGNILNILTFVLPVIILLIMYFIKKNKKDTQYLLIVYIISILIMVLLKYIIFRERPTFALISIPFTPSFPSGHTFTSIVFYSMLGYILYKKNKVKKIYISLMIFALLISISRVYLMVHYLSDVVGALILSIPYIIMCIKNYRRYL